MVADKPVSNALTFVSALGCQAQEAEKVYGGRVGSGQGTRWWSTRGSARRARSIRSAGPTRARSDATSRLKNSSRRSTGWRIRSRRSTCRWWIRWLGRRTRCARVRSTTSTPRITVTWCKKDDVPIEKIFSKTLSTKCARTLYFFPLFV